MTTENAIRVLAGTLVLLSLALGAAQSPIFADARWLWLAGFVAVNLVQSAFTGFCPAALILRRLGTRDVAAPAAPRA